jgi:hypothetical protein
MEHAACGVPEFVVVGSIEKVIVPEPPEALTT